MRRARYYAKNPGQVWHFADRGPQGFDILACNGRAIFAYSTRDLSVEVAPLCKACDRARLSGKIEGV